MDVSKQAFGACYAHVLNMAIAAILADNTRGDVVLEDECAWYAINYGKSMKSSKGDCSFIRRH